MTDLDKPRAMKLRARVAEDAQMLAHLGIGVDAQALAQPDAGKPLLYLDVAPHMVNALEFCHGGVVYALADTACAYALGVDDFVPATVDASVTYIRPGRVRERLWAHTEIIRQTKRLGTCEVRVINPQGQLVLVYRGTCANAAGATNTAR